MASNVNKEKTSTFTQRTRRCSSSPQALALNALSIPLSRPESAQSSSSSMLSVDPSFCEVCYDTSHLTPKRPLFTQDSLVRLATIRSRKMQKLPGGKRQARPDRPHTFKGNRFCILGRGGLMSSHRNFRVSQTEPNTLPLRLLKKLRAGRSLDKYT